MCVEQAADRKRIIHWGPRTLDLDILFYDNEIIDTVELHVPHIDMETGICFEAYGGDRTVSSASGVEFNNGAVVKKA